MPSTAALRWDLFCRVVDNFGDIGVCWRLASLLAARGEQVRLITDDPRALAWMAPDRLRTDPGVSVLSWPGPGVAAAAPGEVADVVVEAFGCDPPTAYVAAMRAGLPAHDPVWINLEYLSAEPYVERSHGLPSPRGDGLRKWFFYPGFTAGTGGLLREPTLIGSSGAFDRDAWLAGHAVPRREGERVVSLFCYDHAPIQALLGALATQPTLLLLTPGPAQQQVRATPAAIRTHALCWLPQTRFDGLMRCCDLNIVRGEDSLVRALLAGQPFLWQLYPQADGAHAAKLDAFLAWLQLPDEAAAAMRAWNRLAPWPDLPDAPGAPQLPQLAPWRAAVEAAAQRVHDQDDLVSALQRFVRSRCATP